MNKTILIGRLTKDPDIRWSDGANGKTCIARFSVAVDRMKKGETDFISCVAFGKTAEFIEKYFVKGMRIALDGRIQTGSYTNKDGNKVYTTDVVAEHVEFCEKKVEAAPDQDHAQPPEADGFMDIPDNLGEELPFH